MECAEILLASHLDTALALKWDRSVLPEGVGQRRIVDSVISIVVPASEPDGSDLIAL
jgi:hypothetical protein